MALNWKTYDAIPRLYTYAEALAHYNNTTPIRGDKFETRPCGRRDQKWFNIWQDDKDKSIHVGYGVGEQSSKQTIVQYHASGMISLRQRTRWSSASTNERLQRLLGTDVGTFQYDTWLKCAWYDGGKLRRGWLPLQFNPSRNWNGDDVFSNFVRGPSTGTGEKGELVYLNYTYPVTHTINKAALKDILAPFQPFLTYMEGLRKLQGGDRLVFLREVQAEYFGWSEGKDWQGNPVPNRPLYLRYGDNPEAARAQVYAWMADDGLTKYDSWMRAAITLLYSTHHNQHLHTSVRECVLKDHRDKVFDVTTHTDGKRVKDRYRNLFLG